jgi:hypothetical protein
MRLSREDTDLIPEIKFREETALRDHGGEKFLNLLLLIEDVQDLEDQETPSKEDVQGLEDQETPSKEDAQDQVDQEMLLLFRDVRIQEILGGLMLKMLLSTRLDPSQLDQDQEMLLWPDIDQDHSNLLMMLEQVQLQLATLHLSLLTPQILQTPQTLPTPQVPLLRVLVKELAKRIPDRLM